MNSPFYIERELENNSIVAKLVDFDYGDKLQTDENGNIFYDNEGNVKILTSSSQKIVAKGIINNNSYGYQINNKWGDEDGNIIDTIIESVGNMMTSSMAKDAGSIIGAVLEMFGMKEARNQIGKVTNSHIYSASKTVKSFGGTDVSFEDTQFKTRFIALDENDNVVEKVNNLLPYCIGESPGTSSGFWGMQLPPNDYTFERGGIIADKSRNRLRKTLSLIIGDKIRIDNLLISSCQVEYSPIKIMKGKNNENYQDCNFEGKPFKSFNSSGGPLYADVTLSFEFARKLYLDDIKNYVQATGFSTK